MQPSKPNQNGVLEAGGREIVAQRGRAYAAILLASCENGLYRCGVEMHYSHGGFLHPISAFGTAYSSALAARTAALEQLLRSWHAPNPSDPDSVRSELLELRRQIEVHLRQPTLF